MGCIFTTLIIQHRPSEGVLDTKDTHWNQYSCLESQEDSTDIFIAQKWRLCHKYKQAFSLSDLFAKVSVLRRKLIYILT